MLGANLIVEGAVVGPGSHEPFSQGMYVVLLIEEVVQFITENKKIIEIFYILPHVCLCPDRLCGLVVSYKHTGPGFDSRTLLRIFLRELGLERGPLSLVIG
jgi:hypothetical protein